MSQSNNLLKKDINTVHNFNDDFAFSEIMCEKFSVFYSKLFQDIREVKKITEMDKQFSGIDKTITFKDGKKILAEEKTLREDLGNITIEVYSNIKSNRLGWINSKKISDYLFFGLFQEQTYFLLPFLWLQTVYFKYYNKWVENYGLKVVYNKYQNNKTANKAKVIPIPQYILLNVLLKEMKVNLSHKKLSEIYKDKFHLNNFLTSIRNNKKIKKMNFNNGKEIYIKEKELKIMKNKKMFKIDNEDFKKYDFITLIDNLKQSAYIIPSIYLRLLSYKKKFWSVKKVLYKIRNELMFYRFIDKSFYSRDNLKLKKSKCNRRYAKYKQGAYGDCPKCGNNLMKSKFKSQNILYCRNNNCNFEKEC